MKGAIYKHFVMLSVSIYRYFMMPLVYQFRDFMVSPSMSIYRDFKKTWECQCTEILWCLKYVNLWGFYSAPSMSIYRGFMVHQVCLFIHTFYGAPSITIYRDFMMSQLVCQFTDILWSDPEFGNLHSLWCPKYVDLRFYCALSMSVYRVFSSVIGQSFY